MSGLEVWYVGFHYRALGEWGISRGPVNTNPLTHAVTLGSNMCELVHVCRCVICLCQPAVSLWAGWAWLFEGGWSWMGGRAGANPPEPRAVCPAPGELHHAASSVVGPLERYKALWMLSAQTTHCPPKQGLKLSQWSRQEEDPEQEEEKKEEEVHNPPTGAPFSKRKRP